MGKDITAINIYCDGKGTHISWWEDETLCNAELEDLIKAFSRFRNIIARIKQAEPFNNSDCPQWVINIIKGEK